MKDDTPKKPQHNFSKNSILVSKQQHQKRNKEESLYSPSIFQYSCKGALDVSSQDVGSPGRCFGIQSRLSHVRDMPLCTRQEATDAFERVLMDQAGYSATSGISDQATNNDTAHVEKRTLVFQNPALIYKEENDTAAKANGSDQATDEVDEWHEWSCFGSTDVQLLVLRQANSSQKETIAGVAPDCQWGFSIRDVGTSEEGGGVVATVRVASYEYSVLGDYYSVDDEEDDQVMPNSSNTAVDHQDTDRQALDKKTTSPLDKNEKRTVRKQQTSKKNQEMFAERFSKASGKVLLCMQENASFVKNEMSDHFLERTYQSGERVVGNFGKTWDRTTQLMQSVYKRWRNDK